MHCNWEKRYISTQSPEIKTPEKYLYPAGIYLLKVNNRKTRSRYEICSKLKIKTPEPYHRLHSGVFIVNLEHILEFDLVFLLLTLSMYLPTGYMLRISFNHFIDTTANSLTLRINSCCMCFFFQKPVKC